MLGDWVNVLTFYLNTLTQSPSTCASMFENVNFFTSLFAIKLLVAIKFPSI